MIIPNPAKNQYKHIQFKHFCTDIFAKLLEEAQKTMYNSIVKTGFFLFPITNTENRRIAL